MSLDRINQRGYSDAKSGTVDVALYNSDTFEARLYRDGVRAGRREMHGHLGEIVDAIEDAMIEKSIDITVTLEQPASLTKEQLEEHFPTDPTTTVTETMIPIPKAAAVPEEKPKPAKAEKPSAQLSLFDL